MPLQHLLAGRHAGEQRIGAAGGGQLDIKNPDFRPALRLAPTAERIGQQLVTATDTEKRPLQITDPGPDRALFRFEPRVFVYVPDIHWPAHDPQRIEGLQVGNAFVQVELDRAALGAVLRQQGAQLARVLTRHVLKDENFHASPGPTVAVDWSAWFDARTLAVWSGITLDRHATLSSLRGA